MHEATKEQIFDPFFSTKGNEGTGLGLSQVYGFVERNGGDIDVSSELGKGTQLVLYSPCYYDLEATDEYVDSNIEANLSGTEKILVVDDEPALTKLITNILSVHGYQVLCANSAKQALEIL